MRDPIYKELREEVKRTRETPFTPIPPATPERRKELEEQYHITLPREYNDVEWSIIASECDGAPPYAFKKIQLE